MEITLFCKGKLKSPPRKKRERAGMLGTLPDGLERRQTLHKNYNARSCPEPEKRRDRGMAAWPTAHCETLQLAHQRRGKGSKRQHLSHLFFSIGKITATVESIRGCCCQKRGNLTNLPSTPAAPSPLLPSHLLSLLIPNGAHQTGIPLTHPLSFCHVHELNVAADRVWWVLELPDTKEVPEVCTRNREEDTAGIPCYQPLRSTRFNPVTSCNFKLFETTQAFRI